MSLTPTTEPRVRLQRFIARFDRGEFWLAHEELEVLWLADRRPEFKGLIHLAAAMVHAERGNWNGALRKVRSGVRLLGELPQVLGLDLEFVRGASSRLALAMERCAREGSRLGVAERIALRDGYESEIDLTDIEIVELPYRARRHEKGYRIGRDPRRRDC